MSRLSLAYQKAAGDFTTFKKVIHKGYEHAPHLVALDRALTQAALYVESKGRLGVSFLVIEMPPRHGKTFTTSQNFPAWFLGRNPDKRVMLVSYGADLAHQNSRIARNLLRLDSYRAVFPHIALADDSSAVNSWAIKNFLGGVNALGIGGSATGKGADILIIDDPIKNRAEAESKIYRDRIWNAFANDLYTRLEPNGVVIIMATRWHIDDLTGRVLLMDNAKVKRLRLPAFAEENDPLGRSVGDALWESRFPNPVLDGIQGILGDYDFSSLYMQNPLPSRGGLFDTSMIEIIDTPPNLKSIVRFYDLAVTTKKTSDYTVGIKLGVTDDYDFIVLHMSRAQLVAPDIQKLITTNAHIDGTDCRIRLEAAKEGIVQLDYLLREPSLHPYAIDAKAPIGDKYTRATPVSTRASAGKLKILRGSWNRDFLDELSVFPRGAHDDVVDALSGAYEMLAQKKPIGRVRYG